MFWNLNVQIHLHKFNYSDLLIDLDFGKHKHLVCHLNPQRHVLIRPGNNNSVDNYALYSARLSSG